VYIERRSAVNLVIVTFLAINFFAFGLNASVPASVRLLEVGQNREK